MRTAPCALWFLAACGIGGSTDVEPNLRMADRSDAEITRLISASSGSEGFQAQAQVGQFDDPFEEDACPTVVEDAAANRVTVTGGCTRGDGTTVEGTVVIVNPLGWGELDYDFTDDSVYTFDGFALVTAGTRFGYDGVFTIGPSYEELDMDLVTDGFGITLRSDLHMECDRTSCEIGNSGLELGDAGGVLVSGTIGVAGQSASGHFTLEGADTVRVTIENNCVSWQLDGTDRGVTCP